MNEILISVIMPVYNAEHYVSEAVESVLNQTYKNFEFIVIDDFSTDNTYSILEKYAKADGRIRLFRNERNLQQAETTNFGIKQSKGEYIARIDADDISIPSRLARQIEFLENNPEIGVCGSWYKSFSNDIDKAIEVVKLKTKPEDIKIQMYLFQNELANPSTMMRRSVFSKIQYDINVGGYAEDWHIWIKMLDEKIKLANIDEFLLHYRISSTQFSQINSDKLEIQNNKIRVYGLKKVFGAELNQEIIDMHLKVLLAPKKLSFIFKLPALYRYLHLLKKTNKKNNTFDVVAFNNIINQYYLCNKIKSRIFKFTNRFLLK